MAQLCRLHVELTIDLLFCYFKLIPVLPCLVLALEYCVMCATSGNNTAS